MALTDTALKALKPKQKAYVVSDGRSLYAEVLPTGAIVWRSAIGLTDGGKNRRSESTPR